jgi:hypothetical protein
MNDSDVLGWFPCDVSTRSGSTELAEVVAQARCLRYLAAATARWISNGSATAFAYIQ